MPLFYWMDLLDFSVFLDFFFFPNGALFVGMPVLMCRDRVLLCMKYGRAAPKKKNDIRSSRSKGLTLGESFLPFRFCFCCFFVFFLWCIYRDFPELWAYQHCKKSKLLELTSLELSSFDLLDFVLKECLTLVFVSIQLNGNSVISMFQFSEFLTCAYQTEHSSNLEFWIRWLIKGIFVSSS